MTDIVTMPASLYGWAQLRFNPMFMNLVASGSSFNPNAQSVGPTYAYWMADITFMQLDGVNSDDLRNLRAFIMSLQGGKVLARIYDLSRSKMVGAGAVGPTVNMLSAASVGATSISLKNLIASQAISIAAMDSIGIGENVYAATADNGSDSSGNVTVGIQPPLRLGAAANDVVNLLNPTGLFRLTGGGTDLSISPPIISENVTLNFVEEPDVDG